MISHLLRFIWHETSLELRRERLIAITTVSTVAVLLVLLGANLLFVMNLRVWAARAEREVVVRAYFQKTLPRGKAQAFAKEVSAWPEVDSVQFVTREELWQEFGSKVVSAAQLKGLDASTFSDSVRISTKKASVVRGVAAKLEGREEVENVIPSSKADDPSSSRTTQFILGVIHISRAVQWAGMLVALLVTVVGVFVVHNTIRLALHARWREIYIMQLVGATRGLVAAPFLLEGTIQGAIGAALAACVLVPMHMYLGDTARQAHSFLQLQSDAALFPFTIWLILAGMILGLAGSAFSIHRTLRHKPEWQS